PYNKPLETQTVDGSLKRHIINDHQAATAEPERRAHFPYNPSLALDQFIDECIEDLDPRNLYSHQDGLCTVENDEEKMEFRA
ncbi:hypothetical protein BGZ97_010056, partial [Linnemannia gamsii]